MSPPLRDDNAEQPNRAAELDGYALANPAIVEQLAAPQPGRPPASAAVAAADEPEPPRPSRIEQFEEFLAYEFALAEGLRRPVIPTESAERRDELIAALEQRFSVDPPSPITFKTFHLDTDDELHSVLTEGEHVLRVMGIDRDRVMIVKRDRISTDPSFYAIRGPAGVSLIRDALAAPVVDEARKSGEWEVLFGQQ